MQITVKSTKVLKTGEGEYGVWKLVGVTTDKDVKYATFAEGADELTTGSTINITDMDENEKGKSFKKYELVGAATIQPQKENPTLREAAKANDEMTPDKWADKDRITRESIEAQVAFKGIVDLVKGFYSVPKYEIPVYLFNVYMKALDWALARLNEGAVPQPEPSPEATTATQSGEKEETGISLKIISNKAKEKGYSSVDLKAIMARLFHAGSGKDLSQEQRKELLDVMEEGKYKEEERGAMKKRAEEREQREKEEAKQAPF